jgi:hypothetical protein
MVQEEDDIAEVFVPFALAIQNLQMNALLMKFFEGWGHVIAMHQQALVGLRHRFAIDFGQWRQRMAGSGVELIERMGRSQLKKR